MLACLAFAMPFHTAAAGVTALERANAEIFFVGAVLESAEVMAFKLYDEPAVPELAPEPAQEWQAAGEQLEWRAKHEITVGSLDRGVALGVGVPREAERPPAAA